MEGSIGEPLLNADGNPPGGLACGSFGLSRGAVLNPFEPQTATLVSQSSHTHRLDECAARARQPDDKDGSFVRERLGVAKALDVENVFVHGHLAARVVQAQIKLRLRVAKRWSAVATVAKTK